jgi:hypothetical protein
MQTSSSAVVVRSRSRQFRLGVSDGLTAALICFGLLAVATSWGHRGVGSPTWWLPPIAGLLVLGAVVAINLRTKIVQDGNKIYVRNLFRTREISEDRVVAVVARKTYHSPSGVALICDQPGVPRVLALNALSVRDLRNEDIETQLPFLLKVDRPPSP